MAPFLAALIKSGLGLVANAAIEKGTTYLEEKTGIKIDQEKEPSPEQLLQFKQFMLENETELENIRLQRDHISADMFKAAMADTQSAREREIAIVTSDKAPLLNKIIVPLLAIGVLLITMLLFAVVMFTTTELPAGRKDVVIYILGVMSAISTQIIAYYFGSSSGSKTKDETISALRGGVR